MLKIHTEEKVTSFTHTPKRYPGIPNLNVDPFEVQVDLTMIDGAFCGEVIFSMFGGEKLVCIHYGGGHGLSWRIVVQNSDSTAEVFGNGWIRMHDEEAENDLVESFSSVLPEGLRSQARSLLERVGLLTA